MTSRGVTPLQFTRQGAKVSPDITHAPSLDRPGHAAFRMAPAQGVHQHLGRAGFDSLAAMRVGANR